MDSLSDRPESLQVLIEQAEANPVRSRHHDWAKGEQREYNALSAKGRTLYDNLRTQFDLRHYEAWVAAVEEHGVKPAVVLDMEQQAGIR